MGTACQVRAGADRPREREEQALSLLLSSPSLVCRGIINRLGRRREVGKASFFMKLLQMGLCGCWGRRCVCAHVGTWACLDVCVHMGVSVQVVIICVHVEVHVSMTGVYISVCVCVCAPVCLNDVAQPEDRT